MKTLTKLTLSLLAVIALAISANAAITFEDNYTVTSGGGDINYEYNNGVRQSGSASPMQYVTWADNPIALPYVTNAGPTAGELYMPSDGSGWAVQSRWSPNYNFTESGDFSVEVTFNRTGDADWKALNICKDNVLGSIFDGPGMTFMFYPDGHYNIVDGGLNQEGVTGTFSFAELSYASSPVLKVKFVVSQPDFSGSADALVALFINDKPYPVSFPNNFIHTHAGGFTNNYMSVFAVGAIGVENLKVATANGNAFNTLPWSSDADCGITSAKTYTHAVDFGNAADTTINGVLFTGTAATNSGANWEVRTDTGDPIGEVETTMYGLVPNITGQGQFIVTNGLFDIFNVMNPALTITGLTPAQQYILTLYSQGFGGPQYAYVATSDGEMITVQDPSAMGPLNGELMSYQYTANADGVFSLATTTTNNAVWALYAFSNEEVIPEPMVLGVIALLGLAFLRRK